MGQRVCAFDILIEIASCSPEKLCPFPVLGHFPFHHIFIVLSFSKHFNFCHLGEKKFFLIYIFKIKIIVYFSNVYMYLYFLFYKWLFFMSIVYSYWVVYIFLFILIHLLWKEINHLTYVLWILFFQFDSWMHVFFNIM